MLRVEVNDPGILPLRARARSRLAWRSALVEFSHARPHAIAQRFASATKQPFEQLSHSLGALDARRHVVELAARQRLPSRRGGRRPLEALDERSDLTDRESGVLRELDDGDRFEDRRIVPPLAAATARGANQPRLLVISNRRGADAGAARHLSDR